MKEKKTVVIVEDDPGLRDQLVLVLKSARDIECLYTVSSGEEAVQKIPARPPHVVLMDIQLPGMSGIECVAALKKQLPDLEFIMLTVYEDAERIFRALKAGASGYLIKSGPPEKLFEAIRDVHSGGAPFSAHIARRSCSIFKGRRSRRERRRSFRHGNARSLSCSPRDIFTRRSRTSWELARRQCAPM